MAPTAAPTGGEIRQTGARSRYFWWIGARQIRRFPAARAFCGQGLNTPVFPPLAHSRFARDDSLGKSTRAVLRYFYRRAATQQGTRMHLLVCANSVRLLPVCCLW